MGYTTTFEGTITVDPPLNEAEIDYLRRFAGSRRMQTTGGPYHAEPGDHFGQEPRGVTVIAYNDPPLGQPGLWCQWVPTEDGSSIEWDGGEKFYNAPEWMQYLIEHFLGPEARAMGEPGFEGFQFNHTLNGTIDAEGEESGDLWKLVVEDNVVTVREGHVVYDTTPAEADARALDRLAAYLRDTADWNGADFCELAADLIADTGRAI